MYDRVTLSLNFIDFDSDSTPLSRQVESSKVLVQTFPSVLNANLVAGKDEFIGFISDAGCLMSWFRDVKCLEIREELDTVAVTTGCDLEVRVTVKDVCVIESTRTIGDVTSSVGRESETVLNGALDSNFTIVVAVEGNSSFENDILFCVKSVISRSESSWRYVPEKCWDIWETCDLEVKILSVVFVRRFPLVDVETELL